MLGNVLLSFPFIERRPETLVPHQESSLAMRPPVGHHILHLPPCATSRVENQRFRLSIFFRWTEVGWSLLIWSEAIHIDDRVNKAEPRLRGNLQFHRVDTSQLLDGERADKLWEELSMLPAQSQMFGRQ
jgi:hypothetical protein